MEVAFALTRIAPGARPLNLPTCFSVVKLWQDGSLEIFFLHTDEYLTIFATPPTRYLIFKISQ